MADIRYTFPQISAAGFFDVGKPLLRTVFFLMLYLLASDGVPILFALLFRWLAASSRSSSYFSSFMTVKSHEINEITI